MNKIPKQKYFDKSVINKPWGYEYTVYRNKNKLNVTYLNINPGEKTSLHCHYSKKTGFIVASGKAKIQLGLYKRSSVTFSAPSKLMIRTGLFHQIENIGKKNLEIFEFENPSDKFDLIRFKDHYGRKGKNYETTKNKNIIKKFDFFSKKDRTFNFKNCQIKIKFYENLKDLIFKSKNSTIHTLLDGNIINNLNRPVVPLGDVIRNGTLKKMAEEFKIKNKIRVFSVYSKI